MRTFFIFLTLIISLSSFSQEIPTKKVQTLINHEITAIKESNLKNFVSLGTDEFKKLEKKNFNSVTKQLAPLLQEKYQLQYLTSLKTGSFIKHIGKLSFDKENDDNLVSMVLNSNNEIAGFWIR